MAKDLRFDNYRFTIEREPLIRPFHFKGSYFTEKWINVISLRGLDGGWATGIGGNAVLWSDPAVFGTFSETGGNILMAALAERGARILQEQILQGKLREGPSFQGPLEALEAVLPPLHEFGKTITGHKELRPTFTLNALVCLDLALWKLTAQSQRISSFGELLPEKYRQALGSRQERLAHVPLVTYNLPLNEVVELVRGGHFFLKIKIGQPGSQEEMLAQDLRRLEELHTALQDLGTPYTEDGRLRYYLDANGRYETKEGLLRLLDGAEKIGLIDQIVLLEEPFPEEKEIDVSDLPVRVAADESLHNPQDVVLRIELGYRAIALKPAGKTLSMSLLMVQEAARWGVPCFVADSACVPLLVGWNKNVAARLPAFPGLSMGILESNGAQNYRRWGYLLQDQPLSGRSWHEPRRGLFHLNRDYYSSSGGIFLPYGHYEELSP